VVTFQGALQKTDVPAISGVCGKNEKTDLVVTGGAADDRLVLTYDGQSTGELAYDSTSAQIAAALKGLNNIGDNDVAVTDGDPAGWVSSSLARWPRTDTPAITGVLREEREADRGGLGRRGRRQAGPDLRRPSDRRVELRRHRRPEIAAALKLLQQHWRHRRGGDGRRPGRGWVVEFIGALAKTDVAGPHRASAERTRSRPWWSGRRGPATSWFLTYDGQSTGELNYDATSAEIATALKLLSNIGTATWRWTGRRPGGAGWSEVHRARWRRPTCRLLTGVCGKNEKQTVVVTGGSAGDKLVLTYDGQSTGELAYEATPPRIAVALKGLNNIGDTTWR